MVQQGMGLTLSLSSGVEGGFWLKTGGAVWVECSQH
jgi:hypothetical protein